MFQRPGCGGAGGGKRRDTSWVLHDAVDTARAKKQVDDSALWIVRGQASCCMIAVLKAASARAPASPNPRAAYSATNRVYTSPTRSHPHLRKHRQITNTCLPPSSRCPLLLLTRAPSGCSASFSASNPTQRRRRAMLPGLLFS